MSQVTKSGTFRLGDRRVHRLGYGAMQLAGPGVFGPPRDRDAALAVLRAAIESGIDHIDTSDFYGPHVTNRLIREALHPYRDDLVIVTKIGARRDDEGGWLPAFSREELAAAVHDNLRHLGLDVLDVVNLRVMFDTHGPAEGSIAPMLEILADLQRQGLVRHVVEGRTFVYHPKKSSERTIRELTRKFVDRVFDGALDRVMVALLDSKPTTAEDLERLRNMIDEAQKQSSLAPAEAAVATTEEDA